MRGGRILSGLICAICYDEEPDLFSNNEMIKKRGVGGNFLPRCRLYFSLNVPVLTTGDRVNQRQRKEQDDRERSQHFDSSVHQGRRKAHKEHSLKHDK